MSTTRTTLLALALTGVLVTFAGQALEPEDIILDKDRLPSARAAKTCDAATMKRCDDAFGDCLALLPWRINPKAPQSKRCLVNYKLCIRDSGC